MWAAKRSARPLSADGSGFRAQAWSTAVAPACGVLLEVGTPCRRGCGQREARPDRVAQHQRRPVEGQPVTGQQEGTGLLGQVLAQPLQRLALVGEDPRAVQPAVVLEQHRVEEARRTGVRQHQPWLHRPDQPGDGLELADPLALADPGPVLLAVVVADRVPARAGHLHAHQVDRAADLVHGPSDLAQRDPGVVGVQHRRAGDRDQHRRVVAHRALLGDHGQPVPAGAERVALPGVEDDHPPAAGGAQPALHDRGGVARHHDRHPGRQAGQVVEVQVVQVLVGDDDHVDVLEQRAREVLVVGEREPRPEEGAARGHPRVGEEPHPGRVDPESGMTQRCDDCSVHPPTVPCAAADQMPQPGERAYVSRTRLSRRSSRRRRPGGTAESTSVGLEELWCPQP